MSLYHSVVGGAGLTWCGITVTLSKAYRTDSNTVAIGQRVVQKLVLNLLILFWSLKENDLILRRLSIRKIQLKMDKNAPLLWFYRIFF